MLALICWFCDKGDKVTEVVREFAFVEAGNKPILNAHPSCVEKSEAGDSLVLVPLAGAL